MPTPAAPDFPIDLHVPLTQEQFDKGETTHVTDASQLFDPRYNKLVVGRSYGQLLKFLSVLYTRANIEKNKPFFFGGAYEPNRITELADRLVESLPDSQLPLLAFTNFYCDYGKYLVTLLSVDTGGRAFHVASRYRGDYYRYQKDSLEYKYLIEEAFPEAARNLEANPIHFWNIVESNALAKSLFYWAADAMHISSVGNSRRQFLKPSMAICEFSEGASTGKRVRVRLSLAGVSVDILQYSTDKDRSNVRRLLGYDTSPLDTIYNELDTAKRLPSNPYLGVELEFATDYAPDTLIDAQHNLFAIYKSDSSVNGCKNNRMEMVTLPLTFEEHRKQFALWFKKLDMERFDTSTETNNGMHVHIDRRHFGPNAANSFYLRKFTWFITFPGNVPFMLAVSERNEVSFRSYSNVPTYHGRSKSNAFVNCLTDARSIRGAVNLGTNKPTVELRLFKGIVSYATVIKNLEFTMAVLEFTKDASYSQLTIPHFLEWLEKTPKNKFQTLKEFIDKIEMEGIKETSELAQYIFTETDPMRIRDLLKDKDISIKNTHVRFLNKLVGRKAFITSDGKLELSTKWQGKVAHLDKNLIDRYASVGV